ncbi:MAG: hypothetical protein JSU94_13410 [Phycisphaerales bacterium]|nr:MAG: hypothetical protein JSU94_13410 [Phycisphaerales bacterium]
MNNRKSCTKPAAFIVGRPSDELVRHAIGALGRYNVEFVLCEDVYDAVSKLARQEGGNILVIGRLGELSREEGRFFRIVCGGGFSCCCLADGDVVRRQDRILGALENGVVMIREPMEIEGVVAALLRGAAGRPPGKERKSKTRRGIEGVVSTLLGSRSMRRAGEQKRGSAFLKDDFMTTKDERDALLGA